MRSNVVQNRALKQEIDCFFGPTEVRLFGSRVDGTQRGFTLVELITIIVILGILAVAAIPRFFDRATFDNRAFRDEVVSTLRYAQKQAIAQRRFVCVTFTANSISLASGTNSDCTAGAGVLVSPSGAAYPLTSTQASQGSQASFNPVPTNFSFDCLGRPRSMAFATGICGNTLAVLAANRTVQVSNVAAITIWQETGYVR